MAIDLGDLTRRFTFRQTEDGTGTGIGPDGATHDRFRSWKEALHQTVDPPLRFLH